MTFSCCELGFLMSYLKFREGPFLSGCAVYTFIRVALNLFIQGNKLFFLFVIYTLWSVGSTE